LSEAYTSATNKNIVFWCGQVYT